MGYAVYNKQDLKQMVEPLLLVVVDLVVKMDVQLMVFVLFVRGVNELDNDVFYRKS